MSDDRHDQQALRQMKSDLARVDGYLLLESEQTKNSKRNNVLAVIPGKRSGSKPRDLVSFSKIGEKPHRLIPECAHLSWHDFGLLTVTHHASLELTRVKTLVRRPRCTYLF
jgi:hypothetical protein